MHGTCYLKYSNCRLYEHPRPTKDLIREYTHNSIHAIDKTLIRGSDRDNIIKVCFRLDVYRRLFRNKLELYLDDFNTTYFPLGWDQCSKQHKEVDTTTYTGCKI